eukprot:1034108-Prymnesium_polylepis.2
MAACTRLALLPSPGGCTRDPFLLLVPPHNVWEPPRSRCQPPQKGQLWRSHPSAEPCGVSPQNRWRSCALARPQRMGVAAGQPVSETTRQLS